MLLIIDIKGRRYCRDKRWRSFALFGTGKSCVKVYKTLLGAKIRSFRVKGRVIRLPEGHSIEAGGKVLSHTACPDRPGYERVHHHKLSDFLVGDSP